MVKKHDKHFKKQEEREASILLQFACLGGLVFYSYLADKSGNTPNVYIIIALAAGFIGVAGIERIINAISRLIGRR